jgi:hypothetical protein
MQGQHRNPARRQGLSLIGLLFWLALGGFVVVIALKTFPSVNEYFTIQRTVNKIAHEGASTVPEIRAAFDKQKEIEYSISTISGKDLEVSKDNDRIVISFKYDKLIELYGPVNLLIRYEGHSR